VTSLVDTLTWLCEISSFTGEEGPLCDAVEQRLKSAKLAAPVRRYENSLLVPVSRGTGGPHIALAGHLDVVRTEHDGPVRIEGDRFYGPGSSDMKAGLAVMLDLLEHDRELFDAIDTTMVFYSKEEGPYLDNELRFVLEDDDIASIDLAICLEPSDNRLSLGATGSIHAGVHFEGRTCHSALLTLLLRKCEVRLSEAKQDLAAEVLVEGKIRKRRPSAAASKCQLFDAVTRKTLFERRDVEVHLRP